MSYWTNFFSSVHCRSNIHTSQCIYLKPPWLKDRYRSNEVSQNVMQTAELLLAVWSVYWNICSFTYICPHYLGTPEDVPITVVLPIMSPLRPYSRGCPHYIENTTNSKPTIAVIPWILAPFPPSVKPLIPLLCHTLHSESEPVFAVGNTVILS